MTKEFSFVMQKICSTNSQSEGGEEGWFESGDLRLQTKRFENAF